jgi:broad specificity phosphatase PhoE
MVIEIYIVRHGETIENLEEIIQGQRDGTLSERGEQQAKELGEILKNYEFDKVYSSDQGRTKKTTKRILEKLVKKLEPEYDADLRERDYGHIVGMTMKEAGLRMEDVARLYALDQEDVFHDAESLEQMKVRVGRFIKDKIINSKKKKILIVGHEWTNSYLINELLGEEISEETYRGQKNCQVMYFKLSDEGKVLEYDLDKNDL